MTDEVWRYFIGQYEKCSFRVVPGHWPDFKSKEDVDKWIQVSEKISNVLFEEEEQK